MPSRLVVRMGVRVAVVAVQTPGHHAALGNGCLLHGTLAQAGLRLAPLNLPPLGSRIYEFRTSTPHRGASMAGVAASSSTVVIRSPSRVPSVPVRSTVFAMMRTP